MIMGGYGNNQTKEGRLILVMYKRKGRAVETMFWSWWMGFGSVAWVVMTPPDKCIENSSKEQEIRQRMSVNPGR